MQELRVRMLRRLQHVVDSPGLDHLAPPHHHDVAAEVMGGRQIVGNEDRRHSLLLLEVEQDVHDHGAYRHVEHRDRFVGDDHLRLHQVGSGQHHALALAPAELMRIAAQHIGRAQVDDLAAHPRSGPRVPCRDEARLNFLIVMSNTRLIL